MSYIFNAIIILGGLFGILVNLFLFISMPAIIIWKLYRKIKYKISMFD